MPTQHASISAPFEGGAHVLFPDQSDSSRTERLAALAELNLSTQTPALLMPRLGNIPGVRSLVEGSEDMTALAASLAGLGFGDIRLWKDVQGNAAKFIKTAMKRWIDELGTLALDDVVDYHLSVTDNPDTELTDGHGKLFLHMTLSGCGVLCLGKTIRALEAHETGLGKSFYAVLSRTLNRWMRTYDLYEAERWVDYMRESAEGELDGESDLSPEEQWEAMGIVVPDLYARVPECIREPIQSKLDNDLRVLRHHSDGPFHALIAPVLEMEAFRAEPRNPLVTGMLEQNLWESPPVPSWVIHFEEHDTVLQAFDDESQTYNETTSEPAWLGVFTPSNAKELASALAGLEKFLRVNVKTAQLKAAIEDWEKKNGSISGHRLDNVLLAA